MEITVQGTQYSLLFVLRHNQYRCTGAACVWRRLNEKGLLIMRSQLQAMAPGLRLVVVVVFVIVVVGFWFVMDDFSQTFPAMLLRLVGTADTAGDCEKKQAQALKGAFALRLSGPGSRSPTSPTS